MTKENELLFLESRGPFKVVERHVLHDRFGMQLIADTVIGPDGREGKQFWVNFPHGCVLIYPMDDAGNIYLSREFTYASNEEKIEAAGGSIDEGETPEEAAIREVKEELGIEVDPASLHPLGKMYTITSRVNLTAHSFLAKVTSVGEPHPESGEIIQLIKVPFPTAMSWVRDGIITTAIVIAALYRIEELLRFDGQTSPQ